jgi:predicted enzyme related to lactoylglutathione lyase
MSVAPQPRTGAIVWADLTVRDASRVRDFYAAVAGWESEPVPVGGYAAFVMKPPRPPGFPGGIGRRAPGASRPFRRPSRPAPRRSPRARPSGLPPRA